MSKVQRHILVVGDEGRGQANLTICLETVGYVVSKCPNLAAGRKPLEDDLVDLALIDLGRVVQRTLDAVGDIRRLSGAGIILLADSRQKCHEVYGLEIGADDYITKPYDDDILRARIKAVLRRVRCNSTQFDRPEPLILGDLAIDPAAHTVFVGGHQLDVNPREFSLLYALAVRAGRAISTQDLSALAWGLRNRGNMGLVHVTIHALRQKLGDDPRRPNRIQSIRGVGYRLFIGGMTR